MKITQKGSFLSPLVLMFVLFVGSHGADNASSQIDVHRFTPGDGVIIKVYPDTLFLNGTYPIDSEGYADLPLVGMVRVSEMSDAELSEHLLTTYVDYLRYPYVQTRPAIRVSLLGGFASPGMYYVDPRSSVFDVLQVAGGPQRRDGLRKLHWERDNRVVSRNLIPHVQSGESLYTIGFRSGDQIWVTTTPRRRFWEIFTSDIVPVVSVTISTIATAITISQID
ncbi:MAG: polysaccharide biosynthesis/export family protein [Chitinivibrionales bacterium]